MKQMTRRSFVHTSLAGAALAGLAAGARAADAAAAAKPVDPELAKRREALLAEMEKASGIAVPRTDGQFLNLLVHALDAKHVLEVGTYRGYSGLWIGMALEETGGRLTTLEIDPDRVKEAGGNFEKAGLTGRIAQKQGDAHALIPSIEGPFDLVFLDAEKGGELDYFEKVFPKLRPGGMIALHNAIRHQGAMKSYLDMVQSHPKLASVVVSTTMRDGFSLSVKKR